MLKMQIIQQRVPSAIDRFIKLERAYLAEMQPTFARKKESIHPIDSSNLRRSSDSTMRPKKKKKKTRNEGGGSTSRRTRDRSLDHPQ